MENSPLLTSGVAARLYAESPFSRYSTDQLHQGLVTYENEELIYEHPERCPTIEIVDTCAIEVEGYRIDLSELRVFALNALRLNQGFAMASEDFYDLGFRGEAKTVHYSLQGLRQAMAQGSGETFIEQERPSNGKVLYTLAPEVRVVDRRNELQLTATERLLAECGAMNNDGTVRMCENGSIDFAAPRFRARVNRSMVNEYRDQARADLAIAQFLDMRLGRRSAQSAILPVGRYEPPLPEEVSQLFAAKEQALATYLMLLASQEEPTEQQQQIVVAGVRAGYEIFARHMDLIDKHARMWAKPSMPYHEIYQESAMILMDAVFNVGYDSGTGPYIFRHQVKEMIKSNGRYGLHPLQQFFSQPVSFPSKYYQDKARFNEARDELRDIRGHDPSAADLAKHLRTTTDRVLGMWALAAKPRELDYYSEENPDYLPPQLHLADPAHGVLEKIEQRLAVEGIFASEELTVAEKVVLSLHYQIFQPSLCGVNIQDGTAAYQYPATQEEFTAQTAKMRTLHSLAVDVFGFHSHYATTRHKHALRKARAILRSMPAFDTHGRDDTAEARQADEQDEAERQQIIATALAVSPSERLGKEAIQALSSEGKIDFNAHHIVRLFGSLPDFQKACGFEPDKSVVFRDATPEELIRLALSIKPDGPLKFVEIAELSKQGDFPSQAVVTRLFGSLPDFQKACGFEPVRTFHFRNLTQEQAIEMAQALKPDGPLTRAEVNEYAKQGKLPGYSAITRLFGSLPDFQKACGFEPNVSTKKPKKTEG